MRTAQADSTGAGRRFWRVAGGLAMFAISFGYVEAAVVTYLRFIYAPLRLHFHPGSANDLFPLLSLDELRTLGPEHVLRLKTELVRELATLGMLAGAALLVARNLREWVAAFAVAFGIWDICFYVFLKALLDWPPSLLTWDILFLVPVPWTGPVLAPVVTSASMIAAGFVILSRGWKGEHVHITRMQWASILTGGVLILVAFMWDFRNTSAGGFPNPFNWTLFLVGECIGLAGFLFSLRNRTRGA